MALFIEVTEGEQIGQRFRIAPGLRVGRTTGEILIKDPKVSSLHAQLEKDPQGQLVLVDRDSSNGLRIAGQRVSRVAMMPGVKFQIGKTLFKVVQLFGEENYDQPEMNPDSWKDVLKHQIPKVSARNKTGTYEVRPFNPAIQLDFVEGIQAETSVTLGYGPRKIGGDVLDIELHEPGAPPVAFEIHPDPSGAHFITNYPKQVLLNDVSLSSDTLKNGDEIRVGKSLIRVKLLD